MTVLRKCTDILLWNWPRRPHPVISSLRHSFVPLSFPYTLTLWHPRVLLPCPHILPSLSTRPFPCVPTSSHTSILILTSSHSRQNVLTRVLTHTHIFVSVCLHILTSLSYPHILTFWSSNLQWRTEGRTPPPKFRRPSKIVRNSTRLWKLLKIAEFRAPTPQDVRKKRQ